MQYQGHQLRHELKYYISQSTYHSLRATLRAVIGPDPNMPNEDGYLISSLYFDDLYSTAANEKISGTRFRKKFRLRSYGYSDSLIKLECKQKYDEYISKVSAKLSRDEYDALLRGDYGFLAAHRENVCHELLAYHKTRLLKPVVTVDYLREAYISPLGNVRITFDKDISTSVNTLDIFDPLYQTTKVLPEGLMVMEVKYDDYLPAHIHALLQTATTDRCAISKYVMCRKEKRMVKFR